MLRMCMRQAGWLQNFLSDGILESNVVTKCEHATKHQDKVVVVPLGSSASRASTAVSGKSSVHPKVNGDDVTSAALPDDQIDNRASSDDIITPRLGIQRSDNTIASQSDVPPSPCKELSPNLAFTRPALTCVDHEVTGRIVSETVHSDDVGNELETSSTLQSCGFVPSTLPNAYETCGSSQRNSIELSFHEVSVKDDAQLQAARTGGVHPNSECTRQSETSATLKSCGFVPSDGQNAYETCGSSQQNSLKLSLHEVSVKVDAARTDGVQLSSERTTQLETSATLLSCGLVPSAGPNANETSPCDSSPQNNVEPLLRDVSVKDDAARIGGVQPSSGRTTQIEKSATLHSCGLEPSTAPNADETSPCGSSQQNNIEPLFHEVSVKDDAAIIHGVQPSSGRSTQLETSAALQSCGLEPSTGPNADHTSPCNSSQQNNIEPLFHEMSVKDDVANTDGAHPSSDPIKLLESMVSRGCELAPIPESKTVAECACDGSSELYRGVQSQSRTADAEGACSETSARGKSYRRHRRTRSVQLLRDAPRCTGDEELHRGLYSYDQRKHEITRDIRFDFGGMVAFWCLGGGEQLRPDLVVTVLARHDQYVSIRDCWSYRLSAGSKRALWSGVVVEFADRRVADVAARDLSMIQKNIRSIAIAYLLDLLVDAELRHPMCGIGCTVATVQGNCSSYIDLEMHLSTFGDIRSITFLDRRPEQDAVCEVSFAYASQAYAAKLFFGGFPSGFSVRLVETMKEKEILGIVRRKLMEDMDDVKILKIILGDS